MTAERLRRFARNGWVHVLFAFIAMGGWALFVNRGHAMPRPVYAGLVQGVMSACLTLFLKSVVDWLSRRIAYPMRLWAPPAIACLGSASLLVAIHAATGTPEIGKTIAVPLLVSTSYATLYNYAISARRGP